MSCKSPLVWFCNIPIRRFSPIFSLKTTKARVIQNEACKYIGVPESCLPEVCMSDSVFGTTTLGGLFPQPVPICGVLGDSHAALLGQNCRFPSCARTAAPLRTEQVPDAVSERHSASDGLCVGRGRAFRLRCSVRSRVFLRII